jgi:hypothetical protein
MRSKNAGDGGTCIYMREGNTSRLMAADRFYGEFHDSLQPQSGIFWIPHISRSCFTAGLHSWRTSHKLNTIFPF